LSFGALNERTYAATDDDEESLRKSLILENQAYSKISRVVLSTCRIACPSLWDAPQLVHVAKSAGRNELRQAR